MNWMTSYYEMFYSGRHAGHPLDWIPRPADERYHANVAFVQVVVGGFKDADPDDVQLQELTWPQWEGP